MRLLKKHGDVWATLLGSPPFVHLFLDTVYVSVVRPLICFEGKESRDIYVCPPRLAARSPGCHSSVGRHFDHHVGTVHPLNRRRAPRAGLYVAGFLVESILQADVSVVVTHCWNVHSGCEGAGGVMWFGK